MTDSIKSTIAHVIELLISLLVSFVVIRFFNLGSDQTVLVVGIVLDALAKFARESGTVPDLVNEQ